MGIHKGHEFHGKNAKRHEQKERRKNKLLLKGLSNKKIKATKPNKPSKATKPNKSSKQESIKLLMQQPIDPEILELIRKMKDK